MKRNTKKLIETGAVITAAAILFVIARRAGVAERGNTLIGGEICVPIIVLGAWYGIKSVIRDIRRGLFSSEGETDE